jgi:hypothetical protein
LRHELRGPGDYGSKSATAVRHGLSPLTHAHAQSNGGDCGAFPSMPPESSLDVETDNLGFVLRALTLFVFVSVLKLFASPHIINDH